MSSTGGTGDLTGSGPGAETTASTSAEMPTTTISAYSSRFLAQKNTKYDFTPFANYLRFLAGFNVSKILI